MLIGISNSNNISVLSSNRYEHGKIISLVISISGTTFLLGFYYRKPSLGSIDDMANWLYNIMSQQNIIIIGNFNLPGIDWLNGTVVSRYNLSRYVTVPTHDKGNIRSGNQEYGCFTPYC